MLKGEEGGELERGEKVMAPANEHGNAEKVAVFFDFKTPDFADSEEGWGDRGRGAEVVNFG